MDAKDDRIYGFSDAICVKLPVKICPDSNVTRSGLQTLTQTYGSTTLSVTLTDGDRVLLANQTDKTQNGVWVANSDIWARSKDFDGARDFTNGIIVLQTNGLQWRLSCDDDAVIGTSELTFSNIQALGALSINDGFKLIGWCESIAELRAVEPTENMQKILVRGYNAGTYIGGGQFVYDQNSVEADDGVWVFITSGGKRWIRQLKDVLSSYDAGYNPDDSTTHQPAINRLCAAAVGRTVRFVKGTYYYTASTTLSDTKGGAINFDTGAKFVKAYDDNSSLWYLRYCFYISGSNWKLNCPNIDGVKATYSSSSQGGICITGNDNEIRDAFITNVTGHGISIDGTILSSTAGTYGLRNKIIRPNITSPTLCGIAQYQAYKTKIKSPYIYMAGGEGVTFDYDTNGSELIGGEISYCGQSAAVGGIGIDSAWNNRIIGVEVHHTQNSLPGVCFECQTANAFSNVVQGCSIHDNTNYGVWLRYRTVIYPTTTGDYAHADYNTINGNTIRDNTTSPIYVDSGAISNILSGNTYAGGTPTVNDSSTQVLDFLCTFNLSNSIAREDVTGDGTAYQVPFDTGNNTFTSSGVFTAPVSGVYQFYWMVRFEGATSSHTYVSANLILSNGVTFTSNKNFSSQAVVQSVGGSASCYVPAGTTAEISAAGGGGSKVMDIPASTIDTYFGGVLYR